MANSIEKWRDFFSTANTDIFDLIEKAITVAACDHPYDFKLKRDRIAETLFSCKLTKCVGCCDELAPEIESGGSKTNEIIEMNENRIYSYGDVEELTNEIDEETQILGEVLRIKQILDNRDEQSEALLFESLRRLQLMALSVETLKVTEIGKSVNVLRKNKSKQIRDLAKTLIDDWKNMVDAWVDATQAIANAKVESESVKTSTIEEEEEEGLPSPPLDEGAFFATPVSMELSQFFDDVEDYGHPQKSREFNKNRECVRNPTLESKRNQEVKLKKQTPLSKPNGLTKNVTSGPTNGISGPVRPKPAMQKVNDETKVTIRKKQTSPQNEKSDIDNEAMDKMRLEMAKRKLHERYQEAENAKKRRTIQVVELSDLPKRSLVPRNNQHMRHGNLNGRVLNGRR